MAEDNKVSPNALRKRSEREAWAWKARHPEELLNAITRRDDGDIERLLAQAVEDIEYVVYNEPFDTEDWCEPDEATLQTIETIKELIGRGDYIAAETVLFDAAWPAT